MEKGCIIIYKENKQYCASSFVEEKNERYRIQTDNNKVFFITKDKVVRVSKLPTNLDLFIKQSNEYPLNISELWETVFELSNKYSPGELLELYIGSNYSDLDFFAIINKIQSDTIYFTIKDDFIYPNSKEQISTQLAHIEKSISEQKNKEENKKKAYQSVVDILKNDQSITNPPPEITQLLTSLTEYCIQQDDYSKKNEAITLYVELMNNAGLKPDKNSAQGIFKTVIKCGIINSIDDILPLRYQIKTSFSEIKETIPIPDAHRVDLTSHFSFTIDSETTKDIDDGLSVIETRTGFDFYIHIADPDALIKKDSELDKQALVKGTSVYLVKNRHPMFPEQFSYNFLSLIEGENRATLTLKVSTDKDYKYISQEFCISSVNIKSRLTYTGVDALLEANNSEIATQLYHFFNFASLCRKKREDGNALMLDHHDLTFTVNEHGVVEYQITAPNTKSQTIVQEMMIYFNKCVAEYCIMHNLDSLFISQESPADEIKGKRSDFTRSELQNIFPRLKKSVIGTTSGPHYCMGLSYYTQATSPIRRYLDLTVHRIMKASLSGLPNPFNEDDLRKIIATISVKALNASSAEKDSIRFWSLQYIAQNYDKTWKALVIKRIPGGILCELDELLLKVSANGSEVVDSGEYVQVSFKDVFPFTGDFKANYKKE